MRLTSVCLCCFFTSLASPLYAQDAGVVHRALKKITDVIVFDVFSPPVASRTYAYVSIAGLEAIHVYLPSDRRSTLLQSLNGYTAPMLSLPDTQVIPEIAAVYAMLEVATAMVVSEDSIRMYQAELNRQWKTSKKPPSHLIASAVYGKAIAKHVLSWASRDNYKETRSYPRHMLSMDEGAWKPTPPAYMKAIEPHWSKMRTFILDSAQQFKPAPATTFSTDKNSKFYQEAKEVFATVQGLTSEQMEIANFWDCNPFKVNLSGHVMTTNKKISPGGHWINITALACKKSNSSTVESLLAYAAVSTVLADAFISCWDEKYRSLVIRPESYINEYIDPSWAPILQTPPFPEYTSGHSVVSAAASTVLTSLFGSTFSYVDDTEVEFELPARSYRSFEHAAKEAAISRLYGGIHYRPAIENGYEEGQRLGSYFLQKLRYPTASDSVQSFSTGYSR